MMRNSAPAAAQKPAEDLGQGWTQLTEQGKIYLSRKEKNVFILEGTKTAGFSACMFNTSEEQRGMVSRGAFTLTAELKCSPADQYPDQHIFLLFDGVGMTDLSSGCDFSGVHLCFDTHELRVECQRKNASTATLFAQPNCALLRPQQYVSLSVGLCNDALTVSLSGVTLLDHLPLNRPRAEGSFVGIAVYGRTRCYLRRFRVTQPPTESSAVALAPQQRGGQAARQDSSLQMMPYSSPAPSATGRGGQSRRSPATLTDMARAATNQIVSSTSASSMAGTSNCEEMELAALIERDIVVGDLNVRFEDIGGLDQAKRAINEAVVLPLILPDFFTGIRKPWKGVLLFGPPGTGKTMLAKAVASCTDNVSFFNCSAATLTSKWRGESEKLLRALFTTARARVPCILFFDEVDSMLSHRGSGAEHEASRRFKSEFLIHMDGLLSDDRDEHAAGHLLVLATSNAPWDLDEALRRRLEKRIYIPLPDCGARLRMFQSHLRDVQLGSNVDLQEFAARTEGYSGADVQLICRDASMNPMRRLVEGLTPTELVRKRDEGTLKPEGLQVVVDDFEAALRGVPPSVSVGDTRRFADWAREFGSR